MPFPKPEYPDATNKMGAVDLYFYRSTYRDKTLVREGTKIPEVGTAELWYNRHLYGKINDRGDFIVPKENLFGYLHTNDETTRFALNFVAEAYNEMYNALETDRIFQDAMPPDSPYNSFTVSKSWSSIYNKYHTYIKDIFDIMVQNFHKQEVNNKIKNFNDFMTQFFVFFEYMKQNGAPLTLSGFIGSRLCPANIGGLTIEISNAKYSNDRTKFNAFVNDKSFKIFQNYALKYGFVIDKNIPWRLIANLNSEYMRDKMYNDHSVYYRAPTIADKSIQKLVEDLENLEHGTVVPDEKKIEALQAQLDTLEDHRNIFDTYYFRTYELDMKFLKTYLVQMYRSFVSESPVYKVYIDCKDKGNRIRIKKKRLSLDEWAEKGYSVRDFWLPYYFQLRMAETGARFDSYEIKFILQNTKKVYNLYGELKALDFLNRKLKKRHKHIYKSLNQINKAKNTKNNTGGSY